MMCDRFPMEVGKGPNKIKVEVNVEQNIIWSDLIIIFSMHVDWTIRLVPMIKYYVEVVCLLQLKTKIGILHVYFHLVSLHKGKITRGKIVCIKLSLY